MSKMIRTFGALLAAVGTIHAAAGCCGPGGCGGCRGGNCPVPSLPPAGAPVYSSPANMTAPAGYNAPVAGEASSATSRTASTTSGAAPIGTQLE